MLMTKIGELVNFSDRGLEGTLDCGDPYVAATPKSFSEEEKKAEERRFRRFIEWWNEEGSMEEAYRFFCDFVDTEEVGGLEPDEDYSEGFDWDGEDEFE